MFRSVFLTFLLICGLLAEPAWAASYLGPAEKLHKGEIYRGSFEEERMVKKLNQVVRSVGRFVVVPDRGVLWIVERPFPMTVAVTPTGMTQAVVGLPVMRFMPAQMPFLAEATNLLTAGLGGDFKSLGRRFKIAQEGSQKNWTITCTPLNPATLRAPFTSITAKGGRHLEEALAYHADGTTDRFVFSNPQISREGLGDDEEMMLETAENIGESPE